MSEMSAHLGSASRRLLVASLLSLAILALPGCARTIRSYPGPEQGTDVAVVRCNDGLVRHTLLVIIGFPVWLLVGIPSISQTWVDAVDGQEFDPTQTGSFQGGVEILPGEHEIRVAYESACVEDEEQKGDECHRRGKCSVLLRADAGAEYEISTEELYGTTSPDDRRSFCARVVETTTGEEVATCVGPLKSTRW